MASHDDPNTRRRLSALRSPAVTRPDDIDYPQRLLRAALGYAKRGWHVFPLRSGTKKPAVPGHPAHLCDGSDPRCRDGHTGWEQRATTDPDRITRAWTRRPYGIGIACGPSQLLVVDLDTARDGGPSGVESWSRLAHGQRVAITRTVATPSGGRHLYYQRPDGAVIGNTASRLGPRIDTRAAGGYVVAPPTETVAGRYWVTCATPAAEAPAWLLTQLTTPPAADRREQPQPRPTGGGTMPIASDRVRRYVDAAIDGETRRLQTATATGTRNHSLFLASIALGQLVAAELLAHDTAERVLWANTGHHITAGAYTHSEAAATIASGLNRGKLEPRQLPTDLTDAQTIGVGV